MKIIDVLREHVSHSSGALEIGQCVVRGVGSRVAKARAREKGARPVPTVQVRDGQAKSEESDKRVDFTPI